jgi:hypothetical protein
MRRREVNGTNMAGSAHPSDEKLADLLYAELAAEDAERMMEHLDVCDECSRRVEEMEPAFAAYESYRSVVAAKMPPPEPWPDIWAEMRRLDAERQPVILPARRVRPVWMGAIAASLVLAALVLWPSGRQAEARADVLLGQARKSMPARSTRRRIRIQTANSSFIRPAVLRGEAIRQDDPFRARFEAAHYDYADPLSPVAYGDWRDHLRRRSVKVVEDRKQTTVDTSTTEGPLRDAALTIDTLDMSVIGAKFTFEDRQWVEITQIPDAAAEAIPAPQQARRAPQPDVAPEPKLETPSPNSELPQRELKVWAAIDVLNAGAGAPISVDVESDGRIVVTAYSLSESQQEELRVSLESIPGVAVRSANDAQQHSDISRAGDSIINLSESIVSRAHSLDRLAIRFPSQVEAGFSPPDRATLREMRMRRALALTRDVEELRRALSKDRPIAFADSGEDAAVSTEALVSAAAIVDRVVTSLYADTADATSTWAELSKQLSRLHKISQLYTRSLEVSQ